MSIQIEIEPDEVNLLFSAVMFAALQLENDWLDRRLMTTLGRRIWDAAAKQGVIIL